MTNYEVEQALKQIPGFKGTLAKDMFKGKIKPLESGVINLDDSTGPGTHFACYFNSPGSRFVDYFDSYGAVPPKNIEKYLKGSGKPIGWNTSQYQPIVSVLCGYYCIYFIKERSKGTPMFDIMNRFSPVDFDKNDEMMITHFNL